MHHHGEALRGLSKDNEGIVAAVRDDPARAPLKPRQRALVDYALKLTREPQAVTQDDLMRLREHGLSDSALHDLAVVTAYFNFVNRVAQGLGVELENERGRRPISEPPQP